MRRKFNFFAFLASLFCGFALFGPLGLLIGGLISLIPTKAIGLRAGIFPEVWTGVMINKLRGGLEGTFLDPIPAYDQYAQNDVIHLIDVGGDPDVLVNNTTYPLEIQNLADGDISISLNKFQTKPTRITDDELYAIRHDKIQSVIDRHKAAIDQKKKDMAIHALAPASNTTATPVILTTGNNDGNGRKRLVRDDIIALKKKFDDNKVPVQGRILVLCPDHVADLLLFDQKFADQYYNYTTGKIANLYSFQVYEYPNNPYYTVSTLAKNAFGSTPGSGDFMASVAYYAPRMFKATGSTKAYLSEAASNPETQENLVNFRHYFICLPTKSEAIGAIVSNTANEL